MSTTDGLLLRAGAAIRSARGGTTTAALAAVLLVTAGVLPLMLDASPDAAGSAAQRRDQSPVLSYIAHAQSSTSSCITTSAVADPAELLLGERTSVDLQVQAACRPGDFDFHVVLLVDGSGGIVDQGEQQIKAAASAFVRRLDLPGHPRTMVGVVEFNVEPTVLCPLTNDEDRVQGCIDSFDVCRGVNPRQCWTDIAAPLDAALGMLKRAHTGNVPGCGSERIREVVVLLSDGFNTYPLPTPGTRPPHGGNCAPVVRSAGTLKRRGTLVIPVCVFHPIAGCQEECMKDIGSDPSYLRRVEQPDALYGMLQDVADQALQPITFTQFALVDLLPDFMSYVPDSAAPPLARTGQNGQRLEWNERPVDATGVTYTLMLEPLQTGHLATSLETSGVYKDSMDCTGTLTFTVPQVDVRAPTAVPTSLPTQTPTQPPPASPTTSPVPTATITPTLTATPVVRPVFLPVAVRERCVPEQKRVDVALAIDASTSMVLERTSAGQTKLAAAVDAARSFLDVLRLGSGDQASIVAFNDSAMLLTRLTGDRAVLDRALGSIEAAEHTCLVCAVDVAATELAGDRRNTANTPILILLTDGWSNPRPASEAVERATLAKSAGVVIFTIGLGATVDDVSLTAIASRPSYYYRAPTADQLKDIYRQIAVTIPCPPQAFWPRR